VLRLGSNEVNTLPSGHAAGAVAVALALGSLDLVLAVPFMLLAAAILVATVVGRYHFVVDTVAGTVVALASWLAVGAWVDFR
jgi:membrane-associated phospholipid phosphatase